MTIEYGVFYMYDKKKEFRTFYDFKDADDFYCRMKYGCSKATNVKMKFRRVSQWQDAFVITK